MTAERGAAGAGVALVALVTVMTVLMLQAMRVALSHGWLAVQAGGPAKAATLGGAMVLALASAVVIERRLGTARAGLCAGGALLAGRLVIQMTDQPEVRAIAGSIAVVWWFWLAAWWLGQDRSIGALGVVAGFGVDLAIRIAFRTGDLPWVEGRAGLAGTLALAALAVAALAMAGPAGQGPERAGAGTLAGAGLAIAVNLLGSGNLGMAQVTTGEPFRSAASLLGLGTALGLLAAGWLAVRGAGPLATGRVGGAGSAVVVALALATGLCGWLAWRQTPVAAPALVLWAAGTGVLAFVVMTGADCRARSWRRQVWGVAAGLVVAAGGVVVPIWWGTVEVAAGAVFALFLALAGWRMLDGYAATGARGAAAWVAGAAVPVGIAAACLWQWATWDDPAVGAPLAGDVTAVTYNIHAGFAGDGRWTLDEIADVVAGQQPDVVVLQEVSRGWPVMSGVDQALWLSQRLELPVVYGGTSADGLWGIAVLARAPVLSARLVLDEETDNLRRGALVVELAAEDGSVVVVGTHLADPELAPEQAAWLLDGWGSARPAIVAGDFNAAPGSPRLEALKEAGLVDPVAQMGVEEETAPGRGRIDGILVTPDLVTREVAIPATWASDHRPVAVTVGLPR